jgi:membrane-bound lytic murein transglycosylase MltF
MSSFALVLTFALIGWQPSQPAPPKPTPAKPAPAKPAAPPTAKPSLPQQRQAALAPMSRVWTGDLDGMLKRRVIRVATTYNRTHYFVDRGVQRGMVYEGFKLFEDEINAKHKTRNLRVHVVLVPVSREELLPAVAEGRADVAAAALTVTEARKQLVDFSPPTVTGVDEVLVSGPGAPAIANPEALSGQTLFLRKSSSYAGSVAALNKQLQSKGRPPC